MKKASLLVITLAIVMTNCQCEKANAVSHDWLGFTGVDNLARLTREDKDEVQKKSVNPKEFSLTIGLGSGWHGLNVFSMDETGRCQFASLPKEKISTTITYNATDEEKNKIIAYIIENKIGDMSKVYSSGIADGTQWIVSYADSAGRKTIYCDNYFPRQIIGLARLVNDELQNTVNNDPAKLSTINEKQWAILNKNAWDLLVNIK